MIHGTQIHWGVIDRFPSGLVLQPHSELPELVSSPVEFQHIFFSRIHLSNPFDLFLIYLTLNFFFLPHALSVLSLSINIG